MPTVTRPDGAAIHYETFGAGYPLLAIAPGGVNSQIGMWRNSAINLLDEFSDEFMVIGVDQRNVGRSTGPIAPFDYDIAAADQVAVLDAVGVERAHVWGGCIGVAYLLRLICEAPSRISAAVAQDPVGFDHTNSRAVFRKMFLPTIELAQEEGMGAVVASAMRDPVFVMNNAGGPFARRIHDDPSVRAQFESMSANEYVQLINDYDAGIWPDRDPFLTVTEAWIRTCPAPLLVMPGSDDFHPTGIGRQLCELAPVANCLDVDARSEAKLSATRDTIREFLRKHSS